MGNMNKKKASILLVACVSTLLVIFNISSFTQLYTKNKEFKMVYMVKAGESIKDIAERFGVDTSIIEEVNECNEYVAAGTILKIPVKE
jgi:LysM repeat protein